MNSAQTPDHRRPRWNKLFRTLPIVAASGAVTVVGAVVSACRAPGSCLQCGLCAGLVPMALLSGILVYIGKTR